MSVEKTGFAAVKKGKIYKRDGIRVVDPFPSKKKCPVCRKISMNSFPISSFWQRKKEYAYRCGICGLVLWPKYVYKRRRGGLIPKLIFVGTPPIARELEIELGPPR